MSAMGWAIVAIAGILASGAVFIGLTPNKGQRRAPHGERRRLGEAPAPGPETALLIGQAEADAERESFDRLRGRRPRPAMPPAQPLAPLPPESTAVLISDTHGSGWAFRPMTEPAQASSPPDAGTAMAAGVAARYAPHTGARPAPPPDETGERLIDRARRTLEPEALPAEVADALGHAGPRLEAVDAAVESMFTRAMAKQVNEKVTADG